MDFFDYSIENKFDTIIMNPPFVRHHLIDRKKRSLYAIAIKEIFKIKLSSDLWAFFLMKSCLHLKKGGNIGAILPWSFLQADYAQAIRIWLSDNFQDIQILALSAEYFNDAQERVVLLWLKGYGFKSKSIKISFSSHIPDIINYYSLTGEEWRAKKVLHSQCHDILDIYNNYISKYKFRKFEELGNVKIGVVTGADSFFILDDEKAENYSIPPKYLVPIFKSSKEFKCFTSNGNVPSSKLVTLPRHNDESFKNYIMQGVKLRYHLRAHSQRREPWYCVDQGKVPDAFFPYRAMKMPYMILNDKRVQCTNSIHRIYFKTELSSTEKKWLQLSMLSVPGQFSIEAHAKTYGQGVLKIEPNALKNTLVYLSKDNSVNSTYDKISKLLSVSRRVEAMKVATEFIDRALSIPEEFSSKAYSLIIELQKRRMER